MTASVIKFRLAMILSAAAALAGMASFAPAVRAEEDATTTIEKLFRESVDLYEQGKYAQAQLKLKEMEDKDPRSALVARLVDEAGTRIITRMMADVRMGAEPTRLWEIYRKYNLGKLADKERMTKMAARLVDPNTNEDERVQLYMEFAQLGQHAVPSLAPYLKDATNTAARSYARIAIARMSQRAVLPLVELLSHKDALMRENAILILGDITPADSRALPALKARIEDANETPGAKTSATRIFRKISGVEASAAKSAAQYYYDAANRYYLDRANVAEEAEDIGGLTWHLNEAGDLVSVTYPLWAWNEQMAEENILRGLMLNPAMNEFYALYACNAAAQVSEVKDLLDIANEQPPRHNFSAEEKKELEEWDAKLVAARRLIAAVGKENLNAALNKVHADLAKFPGHIRLPGVGAALAKELQYVDPKGDTLEAGSGLAAGLDSTELAVRYGCAVTLANINRFPAPWAGSEKVGSVLGEGVSENKSLQILLVEENGNAANEMSARVKGLGYEVSVATSGREAVALARTFPPKDVIVIAENIRRDLNALQLMEELRAEPATRYLPVGILHARNDATMVQSRFGSSVVLLERESTGADLKTPIEKLGEGRAAASPYKKRANEVAVACATALSKVDANATQIRLDDAVPHAIKALVNRPDEVRNPSAIFLGRVEGGSHKDEAAETLKRVFDDAGTAVELKRNALRALGRVKVEGLEEVYAKAQTDADQEIREIAAEAFGHKSRTGKSILDFLSANRIDKDKKEK